ncbi:hypothetical protein BGZ61DRAFT_27951 [Ilyonectria robusta]|uniref:uncharacterized protein n=1 Tax=Ilyonectria robusta TaxID=1079257 RepID=UPI001E8EA11E|nr:uncharacterized protein BGZ61DRAFT_27951 [Ilyonectria robusta]KAH8738101.1 hypothetical protein BGZ61DRAFT_27951 [Ilyonectria robusta]
MNDDTAQGLRGGEARLLAWLFRLCEKRDEGKEKRYLFVYARAGHSHTHRGSAGGWEWVVVMVVDSITIHPSIHHGPHAHVHARIPCVHTASSPLLYNRNPCVVPAAITYRLAHIRTWRWDRWPCIESPLPHRGWRKRSQAASPWAVKGWAV